LPGTKGKKKMTAPELRNDVEAAKLLRLSPATLRKMRVENRGPKFLKLGARVLYRLEDLIKFVDSCPVGGGTNA
jgi:hypothetical protein